MDDNLLEKYIVQHIDKTTYDFIMFSWHGGEQELNYLCAGYKMFFKHCRPLIEYIKVAAKN